MGTENTGARVRAQVPAAKSMMAHVPQEEWKPTRRAREHLGIINMVKSATMVKMPERASTERKGWPLESQGDVQLWLVTTKAS